MFLATTILLVTVLLLLALAICIHKVAKRLFEKDSFTDEWVLLGSSTFIATYGKLRALGVWEEQPKEAEKYARFKSFNELWFSFVLALTGAACVAYGLRFVVAVGPRDESAEATTILWLIPLMASIFGIAAGVGYGLHTISWFVYQLKLSKIAEQMPAASWVEGLRHRSPDDLMERLASDIPFLIAHFAQWNMERFENPQNYPDGEANRTIKALQRVLMLHRDSRRAAAGVADAALRTVGAKSGHVYAYTSPRPGYLHRSNIPDWVVQDATWLHVEDAFIDGLTVDDALFHPDVTPRGIALRTEWLEERFDTEVQAWLVANDHEALLGFPLEWVLEALGALSAPEKVEAA